MLGWVALIAVSLYLALWTLRFAFQCSLNHTAQPGGGAPCLALRSGDAKLRIWARAFEGTDAAIYFGGNTESVDWSLPELKAAWPASARCLLNYRGQGDSSGRPCERALYADALTLYAHVKT